MTEQWQLTGSRLLTAAVFGALVAGCTTMPWESTPFYNNAPPNATSLSTVSVPAGFYRVNPGDTLAGACKPSMVEEDAVEMAKDILAKHGMVQGWHDVYVRFGSNTTTTVPSLTRL